MSEHLLDELARYQEYEEYAQKLVNLICEDDELEVVLPNITRICLESLVNSISNRIHDVNAQIERAGNQSMDKFIRRQV